MKNGLRKKEEFLEINNIVKWIRNKIPFTIPKTKVLLKMEDINNILDGHTIIKKQKDGVLVVVTIHVSHNLLSRSGIKNGVKTILVHEFCHIVNPFNPDSIMEVYFPEIWKIWKKAKDGGGLKCSAEII